MKVHWLSAAALVLLTIPQGLAQPEPDDHEMAVATVSGTGWVPLAGTGFYRDMDLTDFRFAGDDATTVHASLVFASMQPDLGPMRDDMTIRVYAQFQVESQEYEIELRDTYGAGNTWWGQLSRVYGTERFPITEIGVASGAGGLTLVIPRSALRGDDGTIAGQSTLIGNVKVQSLGAQFHGLSCNDAEPAAVCSVKVRDSLPNQGELAPYFLQTSTAQAFGHLQITNDNPIRSTNGEATTFVYTVLVRNTGRDEELALVDVIDSPPAWQIHVANGLRILPESTATLVVGITIPFSHSHGETKLANLTLRSSIASDIKVPFSLGVEWVQPPQPAGHHDTLILHYLAGRGGNGLYVDTGGGPTDTSLGNANLFTRAGPNGNGLRYEAYREGITLYPALLLGLDADMTRSGLAHMEFETDASGTYQFIGTIDYRPHPQEPDPTTRTLFEFHDNITVTSGSLVVEIPITPLPAADYVPLSAPSQLAIRIAFTKALPSLDVPGGVGAATNFAVIPEASFFRLPLFEYHDPIPKATSSSLDLVAMSPTEVERAPQTVALFEFQVKGKVAAVSSLTPGFNALQLEDRIFVRFQVPEDAGAGQVYDGFLSVEGDQSQALAVMRVIVNESAAENDAERASRLFDASGRQSPQLGLVVLALIFACARLWRR